jgi:putative membrane protein
VSHPLATTPAALSLEPLVLGGLVVSGALYAVGARRLRTRARGRAAPTAWRVASFAAGLAAVATAVVSPIASGGERLFSAHMVQHLLLVMIAPPLIWLGAPLVPALWGLSPSWRRAVGAIFAPGHPVRRAVGALARPGVAAFLYVANLVVWHFPALYDAAQGRTLVHDLEHALLVGTALLYWWPAIYPRGGRRPLSYGATLIYLVPPMLAGDLIGALLSLAQAPLYATYASLPAAELADVVADQQLGGLIMWAGGGLFWLVPMAVAFFLAARDGLEAEPAREARAGGAPLGGFR